MYQALYRKYRPKTFEDVVGQKVIIKTLTNSILNKKINHAYLFTGPRGTGKTSISKILAKIVNCESLNGITPCNKCVSCTQINNKQNTDGIPDSADGVPFFIVIEEFFFLLRHRLVFGALFFFFLLTR